MVRRRGRHSALYCWLTDSFRYCRPPIEIASNQFTKMKCARDRTVRDHLSSIVALPKSRRIWCAYRYRLPKMTASPRLALLLLFPVALSAQQPAPLRTPPEFAIDQWTTEHGLPQNSVNAMVIGPDGYLWVGTFGGLARFDGNR